MADWVFLSARANWGHARFAQWLNTEAAPRLLRTMSGLRRCRVHVVANPAPQIPGFLSAEPSATPDQTSVTPGAQVSYAAAVLLDGTDVIDPLAVAGVLSEGAAACHVFRATATVVKETCSAQPTPWAQGITYLRLITFHADMAPSAARRSWTLHAPLALRTHVGACRYVQWWIDAVLSPQGPPLAGIVEMRFPSDQNLAGQFFTSARARQDIARDTGHFIAGGTRLYTREQELLS